MKSKSGKKVQKISILAALVLLICMTCAVAVSAESPDYIIGEACYSLGDMNEDGTVSEKDAVYLLYNSLYPEDYPISWSGDFAGEDNEINVKDAIYLKNHANEPDFTGKVVHAYSEPVWKWTTENGNVRAVATYSCACGNVDSVKVVDAEVEATTKAATCIENGSISYAATAVCLEQEYHADKVVESEASGHVFAETTNACEDRVCTVEGCTYVEKADSHVYKETKKVEATCTTAAVVTYTCENCGDTYTNEEGLPTGHKNNDGELQQVEGCNYEMVYTCTVEGCGNVEKEAIVKHSHTAAITTEATCTADGVKTYTCACGDTYTEVIPANVNAHSWGEGVVEEGSNITTYTCAICGTTRTTINASEAEKAEVKSEDLAQAGEVEVNHTSIKLDEAVLGQLSGDVAISAGTADKSAIGMDADLAAQIGENPVYDFSITANGENVSAFNGNVTISLPYTLSEGEDADCIDVWFIGAAGNVTVQEGIYSNGFVTFTTDHFSYYTVTRLTPAQRCEKYGHSLTTRVVAPTCVAEGYTFGVCVRCGQTSKTDVKEALGHDCEVVTVAATCTEKGSSVEECKVCDYKRTSTLPALGHAWEVLENTEATCANAGHTKEKCTVCEEEKETDIKQLPHTLEEESAEATCKKKGHKSTVCTECGYVKEETEIAALGHDYLAEWQWNKNNKPSAVLRLTCQREGCGHSMAKKAVVESGSEVPATCEEDGYYSYKAVSAYNGKSYKTNSNKDEDYKILIEKLGHDVSDKWSSNSESHYHKCSRCDHKENEAKHTFGEGVVIKEAACKEDGVRTYTCTECSYKKEETIPALDHDIVNGTCTRCGYKASDCKHDLSKGESVVLNSYGMCEGSVSYSVCECGENKYLNSYDLHCDFTWEEKTTDAGDGYTVKQNTATCKNCGFRVEETYRFKATEYDCMGTAEMTFVVYNKNNEQIFAFDGMYVDHNMEYSFKLDGDSCEDGYTVVEKCKDCNWENSYSEKSDHRVFRTVKDVSGYGLCATEAEFVTCACGEISWTDLYRNCTLVLQRGNSVTLESITLGNGSIKRLETLRCEHCGLNIEREIIKNPTEDPCKTKNDVTSKFVKNGEVLLTTKNVEDGISHNGKMIKQELKGTSCLEGVTVTYECVNCGEVYTKQEYRHIRVEQESYDLAEYGLCGGKASVLGCACGESNWVSISSNCNWQYYSSDNSGSTYKCSECGIYRKYTYLTEKDKDCLNKYMERYEFMNDSEVLLKVEAVLETAYSHTYEYSFEFDGDDCSDGYTLNGTCKGCGKTTSEERQPSEGVHDTHRVKRHDLADYGFCGGYADEYKCPCGERLSTSFSFACNFNYSYDSTTGTATRLCSTCGCSYTQTQGETVKDGCYQYNINTYKFYDKNQTEKFSLANKSSYISHMYENTFELDGDTCSDGFDVTRTCKVCGDTYTYHQQPSEGYHPTYAVEVEDLTEYGFCGGTVTKYSCACGENTSTGRSINCSFSSDYDEEAQTWVYKCQTCGTSYISKYTENKIDACHFEDVWTYNYFNKDGEQVYIYKQVYPYTSHAYVATFKLDGDSCEDGYTVYQTCKNCDETSESYGSYHQNYVIDRVDLGELGLCGGEERKYACACGENSHYEYYTDCNFNYLGYDEETGFSSYKCSKCSAVRRTKTVYGEKDENCNYVGTTYVQYLVDDKVVYEYNYNRTYTSHRYVYEFELVDKTCENGYYVTTKCQDCDYSYKSDYLYTGHGSSYCVEIIDLGELGMCEGEIRHYQCACGEYNDWSLYNSDCMWKYDYDNQVYVCSECGTVRTENTVKTELNACHTKYECTYTYTKNDKVISEYVDTWTSEYHDTRVTDVVMNDETDCEQGYTETRTCKYCDYSYESSGSWHNTHIEKEYELADFGGCEGSWIGYYKCHCGKSQSMSYNFYGVCDITSTSNTYVDDDGYTHSVSVYKCETCGLRYTTDAKYDRDTDSCMETTTYTITIAVDKTAVDSFEYELTQPYHEYEMTVELMDGAETCDDGVIATSTCKNCGASYQNNYYWHIEADVERIDLEELGSKCGGYAVQKQCACGNDGGLYLEYVDCDMSWYSETPWLGEEYEGQYTTDGWHSVSRYADYEVCAVTDPEQCAFTIRECDYYVWDKENCQMTAYTTWWLGYDRQTGKYQKEMTAVTDIFAYHDYETTTSADGTTITQICSVCDSSRTVISRNDTNGSYYEEELVNTLNNGERKYYQNIDEYAYYKDYSYIVKDYYKYINANDYEYWYNYDYAYDWDNFDCTRVCTYTDSSGENSVTEEDCHRETSHYEEIEPATCTQYGKYKYTYKCYICERVTDINEYDRSPYGHSWYYDYDLGIYECYDCGLQNINGSDGSIVLEDMTAEYGEETNYVIGYWNRDEVDYTYYLSIIYEDANDEVELILDGIEFTELTRETDGINAVVFDQAEAEAAAEKAVKAEGYTGEYALRFAFVPVGSDGDFDYAITLTDKDITQ